MPYIDKIKDKHVVVIGGSAGIGYSVAEAAAANGAHVYIASSNPKRVEDAVQKLGSGVQGRAIDVTSDDSVKEFFEWVKQQSGSVGGFHHLVYTAGDSLQMPQFLEANIAEATANVPAIRVYGALRAAQHAYPYLKEHGKEASITVTSGTAFFKPPKGWAILTSVIVNGGLARSLAIDLAPVRVNVVYPGAVETPLWDGVPEQQRQGMFREFEKKILTGSIGKPEEVAEAYLYTMRSTFTTGSEIIIDGGGSIAP